MMQRLGRCPAALLILGEVEHGAVEVFGLGEDGVFEEGLVGDEGVHGGYAADGGVEGVEELFADAGGDLGSVAPAEHVFVGDDDFAGLADGGGDGVPVVGVEGAEVDEFDVDAGLAVEFFGGLQAAGDERRRR